MVFLGLAPKQRGEFAYFVRILGRDIVSLREILIEIVQLALIVIGVPLVWRKSRERWRIQLPRNSVRAPACDRAVLVHGTISQNLEILLSVARRRICIIEGGY